MCGLWIGLVGTVIFSVHSIFGFSASCLLFLLPAFVVIRSCSILICTALPPFPWDFHLPSHTFCVIDCANSDHLWECLLAMVGTHPALIFNRPCSILPVSSLLFLMFFPVLACVSVINCAQFQPFARSVWCLHLYLLDGSQFWSTLLVSSYWIIIPC
jgi:hypothetical protein